MDDGHADPPYNNKTVLLTLSNQRRYPGQPEHGAGC